MVKIAELREEWSENREAYKTKEVGSGVQNFVAKVLESSELFGLKGTATKTNALNTFVHEAESGREERPDFVLYISGDFSIPVEVKCYTRINEGVAQLQRYQLDTAKLYNKQYGILTDGHEWRFYRASSFAKFFLLDILDNPKDFVSYWHDYIKPENYYLEVFNPPGRQSLFTEQIDLNDPANRPLFFDDVTHLIGNFKAKMKAIGTWDMFTNADKVAIETSYAYLIQFILYKVLVDNGYFKFKEQYDSMFQGIKQAIQKKELYRFITSDIRIISEYISKHIYKPFAGEQESINKKLLEKLAANPTIDEIAPWLDIIIFINKYNFGNLKNEIFGFVYENYLKDLYGDENKGQYFTDPAVVNFMLDQLGYTQKELEKNENKISLIDPSCGAGTFLYSAVDRIVTAYTKNNSKNQAQLIESLVDKNVFGLDIEEFPLFLAEMGILMRLLPLIVNDNYENPINNKLKIFKTKDSISEFLNIGISSHADEASLFDHVKETVLDYPSFMRDKDDLLEMLESLHKQMGHRKRFDYVIGNPPYIWYNECGSFDFAKRIKDKNGLLMNNVYGVNLHSIPGNPKKYAPKPNLYAFFTALGFALLKDGGEICYIIPQTLLTAGDLDTLRYYLAKKNTIKKIITFSGNLFIGRGLKQKKTVATSSLIFVAKKSPPGKNHKVAIVNYDVYTEKQAADFDKYFSRGKKNTKDILQTELLAKVENWNFIKSDEVFMRFLNAYENNTDDISLYYTHKVAQQNFYSTFWFDGGVKLDNGRITSERSGHSYKVFNPKINNYKLYNTTPTNLFYDKSGPIKIIQGSQGLPVFLTHYKILWKTRFVEKFQFSDENDLILNNNQSLVIGSDNKNEILYLLSVLNSPISIRILRQMLKVPNESTYMVPITAIKQYIRVPKITPNNQLIKSEIIKQTEVMLTLEKNTLRDIVDFNAISVQKFNAASVSGSDLVLSRDGKDYKCKIQKGKSELVARVIAKVFGKIVPNTSISLSALQLIPALDTNKQMKIKTYIDNLIFALYFNVPLPKIGPIFAQTIREECEKNEFYKVILSENKVSS